MGVVIRTSERNIQLFIFSGMFHMLPEIKYTILRMLYYSHDLKRAEVLVK